MLSSIFTVALLSTSVFAVEEKRQATSGEQFTAAADQLISAYIPSSALPIWEAAVSMGASAASVTGDAKSILHSALLANSIPDWLGSAIPTQYSSQLQALESNINQLRGTVGAGVVPVVVAVTTTNSAGETITSSITTNAPTASQNGALTTQVVDGVTSIFPVAGGAASSVYTTVVDGVTSVITSAVSEAAPASTVISTVIDGVTSVYTTAVSEVASVASVLTTQVVDGVTSVFSTAVSGGSSVVNVVTTKVVDGVTSVFTTAVSGASSVASEATQGLSSIINDASGALNPNPTTTSSTAGAPTGVIGGAAGILGLVGVMIAL